MRLPADLTPEEVAALLVEHDQVLVGGHVFKIDVVTTLGLEAIDGYVMVLNIREELADEVRAHRFHGSRWLRDVYPPAGWRPPGST